MQTGGMIDKKCHSSLNIIKDGLYPEIANVDKL